jgi:hypothetical protein
MAGCGGSKQDTDEANPEEKDMKSATLFIPGNFEDAYAYMGWLVVVTADKSFRFYSLDEIVAGIGGVVPDSAFITELMFRHNEWLTSKQFKSLTKTSRSTREVVSQFDIFPKPYIQIPQQIGFKEYDIRVGTRGLLDYFIYNRQMYVGGTDGIFSAFVDWDGDVPSFPDRFEKRSDARCINLTGRFGTMVASCGDDGLLWSAEYAYGERDTPGDEWEKAEDRSIKARWLSNGIVNYKTATDPNLLGVTKTRHRERSSEEETDDVVSGIGDDQRIPLQQSLLSEIKNRSSDVFEIDLIQYIFNSDKVVFVYTFDGHFFAVDLKLGKVGPPRLRYTHTYKGTGTRILSASVTKLGAVLETNDRVLHFADGEWNSVIDEPALSVRTFPHARNLHNLISITTENGVYLVGMFDDTRRLATM